MTCSHLVYLASYDNAPQTSDDARFHWVLLIAPKDADTTGAITTHIYHATNRGGTRWRFEHRRVDSARSPLMLGRVQFACIDEERLDDVEEALSDPCLIRPEERGWDCGTWVRDAIAVLARELWLRPKHLSLTERELDGLFEFAERFSETMSRSRAVVGFNETPPTKRYPGPSR